ncbi:MAG: methylenetetrahydrofolate--tRNA-(uracil(54)-C(5))-methyltransferase (FADH(2)-oxidizing) TrmFO [Oscillospiraceae bacterium]|nr:methylenetetrahydrofolate--tRNA-(uracil(54)-C(5))-methyltransferase (FADH(2)-oxidizing) TrmFO [Oscillospiraceae bacterium]MDD4413489.1 methylenetetrahydrofolate--tRNA-(uracil(54)-C(5))-methyltransferase (FADH(2)-oxidizing) TrmFO [Oscillospiraceae bacterium]
MSHIVVVGAGLAGCEAAWTAANAGAQVTLYEMKPNKYTPAHHSPGFAELVCSNSLKAKRVESAAGLLKEEMRRLGSVCMEAASECSVPAGGALAVDRNLFSDGVTGRIMSHPNIKAVHKEIADLEGLKGDAVIIATGPLTSEPLSERLSSLLGGGLSFYDAAAPIVSADSIDMENAFIASRYGRDEGNGGDYINCPMNKEEYEAFYSALILAQTAPLHSFDKGEDDRVYEGCMPIEVLAKRGADSIRYGPMKPVGLRDPKTGHRPWAVLQLRKENAQGSMLNMVGFQTNLKFDEQKRVFGMIPALKNAEFLRFGVMHRNSFINSPRLLNPNFSLRENPRLFFAGQMTGVEGYMESAASGMLAGINAVRAVTAKPPIILPDNTMMGALAAYISNPNVEDFQPMGANFGLLPPLEEHIRDKRDRHAALAERSLKSLQDINFK